jgi:hypothetical protein
MARINNLVFVQIFYCDLNFDESTGCAKLKNIPIPENFRYLQPELQRNGG